MMLEEIKAKMVDLRAKKEEFCKPIDKELWELEKQRVKAEPKTMDFTEHEGAWIGHIRAVDSKGDDVCLPTDEIVQVKNGKPYFSSYNGGIVYFDQEKQKYVKHYYGGEKEIDIIGFYDVVFEGDEDE